MWLVASVTLLLSAGPVAPPGASAFWRCAAAAPAPAGLRRVSETAEPRHLPAMLRCDVPGAKAAQAPRRA